MKWLDGTTDSMDVDLSKLQEIMKDREAWHATVHGVTKNRTRLSDSTTTTNKTPGLGQEDPLEKEMATHGPMGLQRVDTTE